MKTWVLIVIVFLALATVAIWTFATATLYRRGQCRTYPYYWCDTNWACCNKASANANCPAAGGTSGNSYKITDKYYGTSSAPGADDHNSYNHLCIAPTNAIVATYPGVPVSCLYSPDSSGNPILCPGSGTSNDFNNVPGYNRTAYDPNGDPLDPSSGYYGLQGRCTYYSIDDAPNSNGAVTYSYLPGYNKGGSTFNGTGYLAQPYLGSGVSLTNNTNYYFAGNSGPNVGAPTNGFANGPNQADSTNYSAWNRLGNLTGGAPP